MYPSLLTRLRSIVSGDNYHLRVTDEDNVTNFIEDKVSSSPMPLPVSNFKRHQMVPSLKQYKNNLSKDLTSLNCNDFILESQGIHQSHDSTLLDSPPRLNIMDAGERTLLKHNYTFTEDTFNSLGYEKEKDFSDMAVELFILEPRGLDDISKAIYTLQCNKAIMVNLSLMGIENAQRAVDLIAGGAFAIKGWQEQISEKIFLFAPSSIKCTLKRKRTEQSCNKLINKSKVPFSDQSTASSWLKYSLNAVNIDSGHNIN